MKYFTTNKYLFLLCFFNISFFYASQTVSTIPLLHGCYTPLSFFINETNIDVNIEVTYQHLNNGFVTHTILCPVNNIAVHNGSKYEFKKTILINYGNKQAIVARYTTSDTQASAAAYVSGEKNNV